MPSSPSRSLPAPVRSKVWVRCLTPSVVCQYSGTSCTTCTGRRIEPCRYRWLPVQSLANSHNNASNFYIAQRVQTGSSSERAKVHWCKDGTATHEYDHRPSTDRQHSSAHNSTSLNTQPPTQHLQLRTEKRTRRIVFAGDINPQRSSLYTEMRCAAQGLYWLVHSE